MSISKQTYNLDRFARAAMLYDFYGSLLTKKQREIIEMYFMNDLSLSEIGKELLITRQAAGILINRTEKILEDYEVSLKLIEKHAEAKRKTKFILKELNGIRDALYEEPGIVERLDNITKVIGEL